MIEDKKPLDTNVLAERLDVSLALQAAGLGVWEFDPATNQVQWDDRCRELFGIGRNSPFSYEDTLRYVHPDDVDRVSQAVWRTLNPASGGDYEMTYRTIGEDGRTRWIRSVGRSYFDETGRVTRFAGVVRDVTDSVQDRQRMEETEQQVLNSFEQSPVGIALISGTDLIYQMANSFYGRLIGRTPEEFVGKRMMDVLPELTGQGFDNLLREVMTTGQPYTASEVRVDLIRQSRLETIYVDFTYQPQRASDGTVSGVLIVVTDVTQQVLARRKIQDSEAQFRSLIEEAPVATCLFVGRDLRIDVANEAMIGIWGKGSSVLGQPLAAALPELEGQPFLQILDDVFATGRVYQTTAAPCDLIVDGVLSTYYFDFTYKPLRNAAGDVYAIMDMAVDVTGQVLARRKIEDSETRFRSLIEEAPVPTAVYVGRKLIVEVANDAMMNVWGKGRNVIGKPLAEVLPELRDGHFLPLLDQLLTTGDTYEAKAERVDLIVNGARQTSYFDYSFKPLRDPDGTIYAVLEMAADVTQQVLTRQNLQESEARYRALSAELELQVQQRTEEMAALNEELMATNEELMVTNEEYAALNEELTESSGLLLRSNDNLQKFAYVASHDLQEPLRKIQQFGDLLKSQYREQLGEGVNYLERMQSAASRMSALIRDLLSFSRIATQRDQQEPVALDAIVDTVLNDLELVIAETGARVTVKPLPTIIGDALQLGQLFQNLLSNALKFRRADTVPQVEIYADTVDNTDLPPSVKPTRMASRYHRINVMDNGVGFDEKYLDRIFQVFQRLHGRSEYVGTGIGLAICEKVVTNHGGAITATSQPGQGATFQVYLPIQD